MIPSTNAVILLGADTGVMPSTVNPFASGIVNLITPNSAVVMGRLAIGREPYNKWLKFVGKLLFILFVLTVVA